MDQIGLKLFKPHAGQREVINACLTPCKGLKTVTCVIGRKWGKTLLAENMASYWAYNHPKCTVYWLTPTGERSLQSYNSIKNALIGSGSFLSNKMSKGDTEIVFNNGSKILFRSAESEDNLRGADINYLIIDEAAFVKQSTLEVIILPMLLVKGKVCLFLSTPKGKNWLYHSYLDGQDPSQTKNVSFRYSTYDSPYANEDIIQGYRDRFATKVFQQEVEAEFVDGEAIFNNINEVLVLGKQVEPIEGKRYYAGVDIGLINDATVLTIIDEEGNLVNYERWLKVESPELIDKIIRLNELWNFNRILIEENNQGLVIIQQIKRHLTNVQGFNTNMKSKSEIINDLIHAFNMKSFKCVNDAYLRIELQAFIFKQNELGNMKFMADSGFHDDVVMALAIGRNCWKNLKYDVRFVGFYNPENTQNSGSDFNIYNYDV